MKNNHRKIRKQGIRLHKKVIRIKTWKAGKEL